MSRILERAVLKRFWEMALESLEQNDLQVLDSILHRICSMKKTDGFLSEFAALTITLPNKAEQEPVMNGNIAQGALTPLGVAQQENEKLKTQNNRIIQQVSELQAELHAAEKTYGAYIDGLNKEIRDQKAKQRELVEDNNFLRVKLQTRPMHYPDLSAEKATYEEKSNPENLIAFNDGSYKKVKFVDWKHSQWIHYAKTNGKNLRVNPANVNYIEEI